MKLNQVLPQQVNESKLKDIAAAGALAMAMSGGMALSDTPTKTPTVNPTPQAVASQEYSGRVQRPEYDAMVEAVLSKYRISEQLAHDVVQLAQKHQYDDFPKAADILSIVGIESSFRPHVRSNLRHDPAVGLTQIRPGIWGLDADRLHNDIEMQIREGARILNKYYKRLGNVESAVHAYNVGITNYRRGNHNPEYVRRFNQERELYARL